MVFDAGTISVERIKENAEYERVRIKLTGYFDRSRHVLQFDIGCGDVVVPQPVPIIYPSLLNMDLPRLKAYTLESVIAGKFQASVHLVEANSRMKIFYDIYELYASLDFDGLPSIRAILETFEHRKTSLLETPAIFFEGFPLPDKQTQWKAPSTVSELPQTGTSRWSWRGSEVFWNRSIRHSTGKNPFQGIGIRGPGPGVKPIYCSQNGIFRKS